MNYSILLIVVVSVFIIIGYILSIDDNYKKLKTKIQTRFRQLKQNNSEYLDEDDTINLLNFIKNHFKEDNIIIPNKIHYKKKNNSYELNNIKIICYKYTNNSFEEIPYNINVLFVPYEKNNYFSNQSLFGLNGNYNININTPKKVTFNDNDIINTEIMDMIPDIIQLSEDSDIQNMISDKIKHA
jgi:hypothetical protein